MSVLGKEDDSNRNCYEVSTRLQIECVGKVLLPEKSADHDAVSGSSAEKRSDSDAELNSPTK